MPPSNPAQENWTGHILTPEEGRKFSGIQEIWDARLLNPFLTALFPRAKETFRAPAAGRGGRAAGRGPASEPPKMPRIVTSAFAGTIAGIADGDIHLYMISHGRAAEYHREAETATSLTAAYPGLKDPRQPRCFGNLRKVKSQREIDLLQHAVAITAEAFARAYALAVPGTPEYEIQAQFEFTFLRRNAHWGYPCIVASGVNGTTLHYESNTTP